MANKRLVKMLNEGKIPHETCFVDCYNQTISTDVAGTILTGIDCRCMHFVNDMENIEKEIEIINPAAENKACSRTIKAQYYKTIDTQSEPVEGPKPIRLGNIYGEKIGTGMTGNVWDSNGVSPALMTMAGGNRQPLILEDAKVVQVGNIAHRQKRTYTNPLEGRVYSPDGISPSLLTMQGGNKQPKIIEIGKISSSQNSRIIAPEGISFALANGTKDGMPKILEPQVLTPKRTDYGKAIRKEYESHEISEKRKNMTQLEPRTDGISNTISTVQKDNLVIEPKIIQLPHGYMKGNVMDICPSITISSWEANNVLLEPKIIEDFYKDRPTREYTEYAPTIRSERQGLKVIEPQIGAMRGRPTEGGYSQRIEINKEGICNTLTSVLKDNLVIEQKL